MDAAKLRLSLSFAVLPLLLAHGSAALAGMSRADYLSALRIADQAVLKSRATPSETLAIETSYSLPELGEKWEVAILQKAASQLHTELHEDALAQEAGRLALLRYSVTERSRGSATLEIRQLQEQGAQVLDPKVEKIELTINGQGVQTGKRYFVKGAALPIEAAPGGIPGSLSPLELLPLDLPDLSRFERAADTLTGLVLPARLQAFAEGSSRVELLYRGSDFFGRPIDVAWAREAPWPTSIKTQAAAAVLMKRGQR